MRERPILFNSADVRAILSGAKTQTRRAIKPQPLEASFLDAPGRYQPTFDAGGQLRVATPNGLHLLTCPFGQPGDRLWVRETHAIFPTHGQHRADGERWGPWGGLPTTVSPDGKQIAYYREGFDRCDPGPWRPSIHMPRWACRLVLEITDVRVERLQAISEADALGEGITELYGRYRCHSGKYECRSARAAFIEQWESTGGDWNSNPWVWVFAFKRFDGGGN